MISLSRQDAEEGATGMTVGATIKVESKGMSMMEISGVRDDDDGETAKEERR